MFDIWNFTVRRGWVGGHIYGYDTVLFGFVLWDSSPSLSSCGSRDAMAAYQEGSLVRLQAPPSDVPNAPHERLFPFSR